MSCEHLESSKLGPFVYGERRITLDWCRSCGAVAVGEDDATGKPIWTMPIPQTKPDAKAFVMRGLAGMLDGVARILRRRIGE